MADRCIDLIQLEKPSLVLDIGCGSGLSGKTLRKRGHIWIGIDIALSMLRLAFEQGSEDLVLADIGENLRWKPGAFDAAISVSALQWLCNAETSEQEPWKRLITFFKWLYSALSLGGKAALQFYPRDDEQMELIKKAALHCGFKGGVITDNPKSVHNKKYYLLIWSGATEYILPEGIEYYSENGRRRRSPQKIKARDWVRRKKERMRRRGKDVKRDSKYTGRKRQDAL